MEHSNHTSLQMIDGLESKLRAAEERIWSHRLQTFLKQAMGENIRRLVKRMQLLIQEMADNVAVARTHICNQLDNAVSAQANSRGLENSSPLKILSVLIEGTGRKSHELLEQAQSETYMVRQALVADLIISLKRVQDQFMEMWSSVNALESQLAARKAALCHVDLREAWNKLDLSNLQFVQHKSSSSINDAKISMPVRGAAQSAMDAWAAGNSIDDMLGVAGESADTEERIAHTSDTSGRLFSEPLASWYTRDGTGHGDYLKRLKIARASELQQ
ncbi:hypothetical protein GGI12_002717 [Dipsacomyces acuminosporus]|nr:hypothetical protein GGI12_002717 [Dipsacomyces acuminosporus]